MNAQSLTAPMVSGLDPMQTAMATPLQPAPLPLVPVGGKAVDLDFDGGRLSSDAGLVLRKDIDAQLGFTRNLAAVLSDPRAPRRINFTLEDLIKQRVLSNCRRLCRCQRRAHPTRRPDLQTDARSSA